VECFKKEIYISNFKSAFVSLLCRKFLRLIETHNRRIWSRFCQTYYITFFQATLAGFDITMHCSSHLGGRLRPYIPLDHSATAILHFFPRKFGLLNCPGLKNAPKNSPNLVTLVSSRTWGHKNLLLFLARYYCSSSSSSCFLCFFALHSNVDIQITDRQNVDIKMQIDITNFTNPISPNLAWPNLS
jgi:hypothetical protein